MLKVQAPESYETTLPARLDGTFIPTVPFLLLKQRSKFLLLVFISFLIGFGTVAPANAGSVRFDQITQIVSLKPGLAGSRNYVRLRLDDDPEKVAKRKHDQAQQDDRIISETTSEIVEDQDCRCSGELFSGTEGSGKFPLSKALFAVGGPIIIICIKLCGTDGSGNSPSPTVDPVPEPTTLLLFGTGLAGTGLAARLKFRKREGMT